jgi:diadenylate cyclase
VGAGCTLPLTASPKVDATVHTRHKAALGMSESSDAIVVVVSEETGTISIAVEGKLIRGLRDDTLRERLYHLLQIGAPHGLANTTIGQVATKVGDAIKTTRTRRRPAGDL